MKHVIKMLDQRLSGGECLDDALAHLGPLSALTRKYEPNSRSIGALLSKYKLSLVKVCAIRDYISPVKVTASSLRECIGQVRQFDSYGWIIQVLAKSLTICPEGVLVIG
jgi:hypothetical protein